MTLSEFIDKYQGKPCEVGGSTGALNQCVDLVNAYIREVLNRPILLGTNAVDFPEKIGDGYIFIENTPEGVALTGDIVVFKEYGTRYGSAGHIAVVITADTKNVTMFEENYPTGSLCTTHTRSYAGCRGWLRIKDNSYKGYDLTNQDSMKVAVDVLVQLQSGELVRKEDMANLQKQIDDLKISQDSLFKQIGDLQAIDSDYQQKLAISTQSNELLMVDNQKLQADIDYYKPYKARYEAALQAVPNSMTGWELIKIGLVKLLNKK